MAQKKICFGKYSMKQAQRTGYSLIEILIAVLIFGIAMIPVFHLIYHGSHITRFSKESVIATNLANELTNQICSMHYADVPLVNEVPLDNNADNALLKEGRAGTRLKLTAMPSTFFRTLTVEKFSPKSLVVKAKVGWSGSPEHQISVSRIFEWSP